MAVGFTGRRFFRVRLTQKDKKVPFFRTLGLKFKLDLLGYGGNDERNRYFKDRES